MFSGFTVTIVITITITTIIITIILITMLMIRFYLGEEEGFPVSYYVLVIGILAFHRVGIYAM